MNARVSGHYIDRNLSNDTYEVVLEMQEEGRWVPYDSIRFPSKGDTIRTPAGYDNTADGAKAYARKAFRLTED